LHRHPQIHFHFSLKKSNSSARWLLESVPSFMDWRYLTTFLKNNHHCFGYLDQQYLSYWHNYFLTSFLNFLKRDNSRLLYLYNNCVVAKLGTASTGKFYNLERIRFV
jgi:hypothetical protein